MKYGERHVAQRPIEPEYKALGASTPRFRIDWLGQRVVELTGRFTNVFTAADGFQEPSDIFSQRSGVDGRFILELPAARGDQHSQFRVGEQIERQRGIF